MFPAGLCGNLTLVFGLLLCWPGGWKGGERVICQHLRQELPHLPQKVGSKSLFVSRCRVSQAHKVQVEMHRQKFSSVLSPGRISRSQVFLYSGLNLAAENPESKIQLSGTLCQPLPPFFTSLSDWRIHVHSHGLHRNICI